MTGLLDGGRVAHQDTFELLALQIDQPRLVEVHLLDRFRHLLDLLGQLHVAAPCQALKQL